MAMPTTAPLWPVANRPEDLLEIERTPLEDRGLPASTYDVLCRAARVALQPGSTVTEDELCAWAAEHVPERAAAPKAVEVIDAIPLTPISKPFKNELRRLATERAARDVLPDGATVHALLDDGAVTVTVTGLAEDEVHRALAPFTFDWRVA